MVETFAEKVARLQQEIAERQAELAALVLGDQRTSVGWEYMSPDEIAADKSRIR